MGTTEIPYTRAAGYAVQYRDERFRVGSGPLTHQREITALRQLIDRSGARSGRWLDMPCGAGRLSDLLPGEVVRADRDPSMLTACTNSRPRVCAAGSALPFRDGAFAGALCMRLMHHIARPQDRRTVLRELRRVTRGPVLVSFFDSCNLQHLRRNIARRLGKPRSDRGAIRFARFRRDLDAAGLHAEAWIPLRRFISEQWIVLARPIPATVDSSPPA